jgi:hypothetical protein
VRVRGGEREGVIVQMRRVRQHGGQPQRPRPSARWLCLVELDGGEQCYFWLDNLQVPA